MIERLSWKVPTHRGGFASDEVGDRVPAHVVDAGTQTGYGVVKTSDPVHRFITLGAPFLASRWAPDACSFSVHLRVTCLIGCSVSGPLRLWHKVVR